MRAKDSKLSGLLAFAPCSALNFTRQNGNDVVKFTQFEVKGEHVGKSPQTKARKSKFNAKRQV
nr:hypothetical protein [uncultured Campylobacter sp.]